MSYRFPAGNPDLHAGGGGVFASLDLVFGVEVDSASTGAIGLKEGTVFVTYAGVAALTLALPTAGLPSAGGDDGRELTVVDTTGHAHTVTTPASGINGTLHIATFSGTAYAVAKFTAYNGKWITGSAAVVVS